jgi:hypothetical protein
MAIVVGCDFDTLGGQALRGMQDSSTRFLGIQDSSTRSKYNHTRIRTLT